LQDLVSGGVVAISELPGVSGRVVKLLDLVVTLGHLPGELVHGDLVVVRQGATVTEAGAVFEVGGKVTSETAGLPEGTIVSGTIRSPSQFQRGEQSTVF
jgi:hypothetical protein